MNKFILSLTILFSVMLKAEVVSMVDIETEVEPGVKGLLSTEVNSKNQFVNMIFEYPGQETKSMSVADLIDKKQTILKMGPIKVVEASIDPINSTSMIVNVHYMHHYKLVGSIRKVKKFKMFYNAPANFYEAMDVETNKIIKHAYAYLKYVDGKKVGIDRIETW